MTHRLPRRAALLLAVAALAPSALAIAQPTPEATGAAQPIVHRVESGETLSGIAQRYGVRVEQLMFENGIDDARRVRTGARLRVPAAGQRPPAAQPAPDRDASRAIASTRTTG
ncbi:MAG TPA: LysM domain-containing protein, partial [Myxococcota bacterium]|nr:LysM domain-containing protein [Myxococcota bacterium]